MKSWKIPTVEQVEKVVLLLAHKEHYRYFFYKLQNPEWIVLLKNKGFFQGINAPAVKKDRDTISFPPWPESHYLARMATYKPEVVLESIMPLVTTENISIHEDLVDAALAMPTDLAAKWANEELKYIQKQPRFYLLLPEKLGMLMAHLAKGGQIKIAMKLAKVLLEVLPDPRRLRELSPGNTLQLPPEPITKFEAWSYEQILKKNMPDLVKANGIKAFEFLCDLLERAVRLSRGRDEDNGPEDYSYIWRSSIGEPKRSRIDEISNILVSAICDASQLLVTEKLVTLTDLIVILEKRPWKVFRRIALYLLTLFPEHATALIGDRLVNRSLFDDFGMREEYRSLLGKCFGMLNPAQKEIIFNWIKNGPNLEEGVDISGERPIDREAKKYFERWQLNCLSWFKDQLSGGWKDRYAELVKEYGEPKQENSEVSWVGPTAPKSMDELKQMSLTQIVEFLKMWKPQKGWMESSPEGLGRNLAEVIKQQPERFTKEALAFKDLHPTYIRTLISGLSGTLKEGTTVDLAPMLELCYWVVEQPLGLPEKYSELFKGCEPGWGCDPDWGWTRSTIARFLSEAFDNDRILFEHRDIVWSILEPLTSDPDPTPERELKYTNSPTNLSINSTRGEAIHTVMRYALWVHRSLEKKQGAGEKLEMGFDVIPEVLKVLETHLDISHEPSLAIRAVYGQWLPYLAAIDPKWVKDNIPKILPEDKVNILFYDAAWQTYIVFCKPYDNMLEILKEQYTRAIEFSAIKIEKDNVFGNPDNDLSEHLMTFYWRGKLDLEDSNGILHKFWEKAPAQLRGHAMDFVGRALYQDKSAVPPEILERIRFLWENRLAIAQAATNSEEHKAEMVAFGWWFVSKKFDDRWALQQLIEAIKISGKAEPDHMVVEHLAGLVLQMPIEVVNALRFMVEGEKEKEGWGIYSWREKAKEILGKALQTGARQSAEGLIHYLGSLGHLDFGELLK